MTVLDRFRLDGRVAVVTGAGKGIGRGIALCLAEAGADVAIAARSIADIEKVANEVRERGRRAAAIPTDATDVAQIDRLAEEAQKQLGAPSIWVSNAGGLPDATSRYLTRTSESQWDAQIDLNLKAVWSGAVAAARVMADNGGVIINISSRTAYGPQRKNGPYAASKAAVNSLTETLSVELAPSIRVNAVAPGPVPTQNFFDGLVRIVALISATSAPSLTIYAGLKCKLMYSPQVFEISVANLTAECEVPSLRFVLPVGA